MQVVLTITAAYLVFFTSEILAKCSGIIAVMFCGLTVKALGETMINDVELMHHFWEITEWLLNTLLFALGGTVWGDVSTMWLVAFDFFLTNLSISLQLYHTDHFKQ